VLLPNAAPCNARKCPGGLAKSDPWQRVSPDSYKFTLASLTGAEASDPGQRMSPDWYGSVNDTETIAATMHGVPRPVRARAQYALPMRLLADVN
jgi:hypothetical protein